MHKPREKRQNGSFKLSKDEPVIKQESDDLRPLMGNKPEKRPNKRFGLGVWCGYRVTNDRMRMFPWPVAIKGGILTL